VRTRRDRSIVSRLGIIIALLVLANGSLSTLTGWAQDSGAASFTVSSASGNVVIKRADGSSEMAQPGTPLYANDQLASVGRSEARLSTGGPGGTSGASLLLYSDTTVGVRNPGAGAGGFYVADIAQGVVFARTPPGANITIQITNETAGAVAQVKQGGMAVASDVGTGTIAVACEDRASEVAFPYTDMRVPCENNVVRTLSNQRSIDDSRADSNSPISSAVQAAGTNVAADKQSDGAAQPQGAVNRSNSKEDKDEKEKESSAPAIVASPAPSFLVSGPTHYTVSLTWGSRPADLDAHLSFPPHGSSDFVAYFQVAPVPFVTLSPDVTNSGGPETVTITRDPSTGQFRPGEYRFWVHNYSHGALGSPDTFAVSNAQVVLQRDGQAVSTFNVNNAAGSPSNDVWYVFTFTLDGSGNVTVNTVQQFQSGTQNTVLCVDDSGGCGAVRGKE
jgi:hypothetical protein